MDQLYIDNLTRFENVILNDFDFSHSSPRKLANMAYEFGWNDRGAANKNIVASGSTSTNTARDAIALLKEYVNYSKCSCSHTSVVSCFYCKANAVLAQQHP